MERSTDDPLWSPLVPAQMAPPNIAPPMEGMEAWSKTCVFCEPEPEQLIPHSGAGKEVIDAELKSTDDPASAEQSLSLRGRKTSPSRRRVAFPDKDATEAELVAQDIRQCQTLRQVPSSQLHRLVQHFCAGAAVELSKCEPVGDTASLEALLGSLFHGADHVLLDAVAKKIFETADRTPEGKIDMSDTIAVISSSFLKISRNRSGRISSCRFPSFQSAGSGGAAEGRGASIIFDEFDWSRQDTQFSSQYSPDTSVRVSPKRPPAVVAGVYSTRSQVDFKSGLFSHFPILQNCRYTRHVMRIVTIIGGGTPPPLGSHRDRLSALKSLKEFNEAADTQKIELLELEERSIFTSIYSQFIDAMRKVEARNRAKIEEVNRNVSCSITSDPSGPEARKCLKYLFQKIKCWAREHVNALWGENGVGLQVSAFKPKKLVQLLHAFVQLDEYDADDDPQSVVLLTSTKTTFQTCPKCLRYYFFTCLAAKAAVHCMKGFVPELRKQLLNHHLCIVPSVTPRQKAAARSQASFTAVLALTQSVELYPCGEDTWDARLADEMYESLKQLEEDILGPPVADDSIRISYQRGEMVGRGMYGVVYRCLNVQNGLFLALKELPMPRQESKLQAIQSEISTLKMMRHENVVTFFGAEYDKHERKVRILMEYAPKSLRSIINEVGGLAMSLAAHYAKRVLLGLAYLHERRVIHRDIKAANILVTDSGEVKVSDFGIAMIQRMEDSLKPSTEGSQNEKTSCAAGSSVDASSESAEEAELFREESRFLGLRRASTNQLAGTPLFMAPELFHGVIATEASDVWAFGCLLIEMATGEHPWAELTRGGSVPSEVLLYLLSNITGPPQFPESIKTPVEFQILLSHCLAMDPSKRPSARELLEYEFFSGEWKRNWCETVPGRAEKRPEKTSWMDDFSLSGTNFSTSQLLPDGDLEGNSGRGVVKGLGSLCHTAESRSETLQSPQSASSRYSGN